MSRIGSMSIIIPDGIKAECYDNKLLFQSNKENKEFIVHDSIICKIIGNELLLSIDRNNLNKNIKALWGTFRSNINNLVSGISQGFSVCLEVNGVGYKAGCDNKYLTLSLGFSHEIKYKIPIGIEIKCIKQNQIIVSGVNKQKVYMIASDICKIRRYDPYKGKGIVFKGKVMLRKETSKKK